MPIEVLTYYFQHDFEGLAAGIPIYQPGDADFLIDAWFQIQTPWNGATPRGDIGTFQGGVGMFANLMEPVDMTQSDQPGSGLSLGGSLNSLTAANSIRNARSGFIAGGGFGVSETPVPLPNQVRRDKGSLVQGNAIRLAVSQDGTAGGADPGSTQGAATICMLVASRSVRLERLDKHDAGH